MPNWRPFEASDVRVTNRDGGNLSPSALQEQARMGLAMTAVDGETILGCAGVVCPWPGVGFLWMVVSEDVAGHGLWLTRTARQWIRDTVRSLNLHRLEAFAVQESPRNQQWLAALGMTVEQQGVARGYLTDRRAVVRYEWVKED